MLEKKNLQKKSLLKYASVLLLITMFLFLNMSNLSVFAAEGSPI